MVKGIDISSYQGTVDFNRVKKDGCGFVIIKAGQGLREFDTFRKKAGYLYQPGAEKAGLDWGAYWWSDAVSAAEARQEAKAFVKALEGLRPTFPVYMDQEYDSPCGQWGPGKGKQLRTDMVKAFLDTLLEAGYYGALYSSTDWLNNYVDDGQLAHYDKWVAQYAAKCTYPGAYGMWQYTGSGKVDGIAVPVDMNLCYQDYPGIIKAGGYNNWPRQGGQENGQGGSQGSNQEGSQGSNQEGSQGGSQGSNQKPAGRTADWGQVGDLLKAAGITKIAL